MKHFLSLLLVLCLALSVMPLASAATYETYDVNPSTFETFEEACVNGPAFLQELFGGNYCVNPCLADYHEGTTFIYRSANRFSSASAGYRKNTPILVYVDQKFESKEDAKAYIESLGLIDIIEECRGSIVLVTPITPYTEGSNGITGGFAIADQYDYYLLQTAMCNLGGTTGGSPASTTAEGAYYGGTTFRYLIGIDGGATFISNFIASNFDYVTRLAGLLLINGHMDRIRDIAGVVPTYLVNCSERVLEKYCAANDVDARGYIGDVDYYFNQAQPLQIVYDAHVEDVNLGEIVPHVYYNMFIKAERIPVVKAGLFVSAGEYSGYSFNQAPYTLTARNAILNGRTPDGIVVTEHQEERFSEFQAANGEYLNTWYELLPEEVLDGTAPAHSIPLILCNHGAGDDPVQAADEMGLITLAGQKRIAVVAPRYGTDIAGNSLFGASPFDVNGQALPALVQYMLDTYPALDPGRVYATGYSMGGAATVEAVECAPQLFAAAVPMAAGTPWGLHVCTDEEIAVFENVDVAMMFTTSAYDLDGAFNQAEHILGQGYLDVLSLFAQFNEMDELDRDFEANPIVGFKADRIVKKLLNDEYENTTWYVNNKDGVPMLAVSFTDHLVHALHPDYGMDLGWNFMKHYSRDLETGELVYNPYAD